jgi:hypothetical protein
LTSCIKRNARMATKPDVKTDKCFGSLPETLECPVTLISPYETFRKNDAHESNEPLAFPNLVLASASGSVPKLKRKIIKVENVNSTVIDILRILRCPNL